MKLFKNLSLKYKIGGSFAVLIIIVAIMVTSMFYNLETIKYKSETANDISLINLKVKELEELEKDYMLTNDSKIIEKASTNVQTILKQINTTKTKLKDKKDRNIMDKLKVAANTYLDALVKYSEYNAKQTNLRTSFLDTEVIIEKQILELVKQQNRELQSLLESNTSLSAIRSKLLTVTEIKNIQKNIDNFSKNERNFIIHSKNDEKQTEYAENTLTYLNNTKTRLLEYKNLLKEDKDKEKIDNLTSRIEEQFFIFTKIRELEIKKDQQKPIMIQASNNFVSKAENIYSSQTKETNNSIKLALQQASLGAIVALILGIIFSIVITIIITKPINKTTEVLKNIAEGEGDLTQRLEINSNDEIGQLSKWFNLFVDKINIVVKEIISNSNILSESIENTSIAMEQANQGAQEVAKSISTISEGAQNNSSIVQQTTASIQEVSSSAEAIFQSSSDIDTSVANILKATNIGSNNVKEVVNSIEKLDTTSTKVADVIKELKLSSEKIGDIISIITSITEQTNLLALNAAIESARAGEAGKGFAVVAEEIRKLAEESKNSAEQISTIITDIQAKTQETNEIIDKEQEIVKQSVHKVNVTNKEFTNIHNLVEEITNKIKTMTKSSEQQSLISQEMAKAMESLSTEVQDSASASQQVSASIEEQVSTFEEIGSSVDKIRNISKNLHNQTDKFKV